MIVAWIWKAMKNTSKDKVRRELRIQSHRISSQFLLYPAGGPEAHPTQWLLSGCFLIWQMSGMELISGFQTDFQGFWKKFLGAKGELEEVLDAVYPSEMLPFQVFLYIWVPCKIYLTIWYLIEKFETCKSKSLKLLN